MRRWLTLYTILLLGFLSCSDEPIPSSPEAPGKDGRETVFTFQVSVPHMAETRSMADNENTIREIEIMVFHNDQYIRVASARDLVKTPAGYRFEASLVPTSDPVALYFIANISATLHENLNRIEELGIAVSSAMAKEQAYVRFDNFVSRRDIIPMAGEIKLASGLQETTVLPEIRMMRAFARVEIVAHRNITDRFRLDKAVALNLNDHFQIAPDDSAFEHDTDGNYVTVNSPSVPLIAAKTLASQMLTASGNRIGSFYLPEAETCDPVTGSPSCLIVQGYYQNSPDLSYYRVDLGPKDRPGEIKRNHKYTLTVTSVTGPGEPSIEKALERPSEDINTFIIWEEDGSNSIYDKDGNHLTFSDRTFSLHFAKAAMDVVEVETNFPNPYTLEWADDNGNPTGSIPIGYGQIMADPQGDFKVRISDDGKQIYVTALKENTSTYNKSRKLLGRTGQLLFNMTVEQATKEARRYLKLYNPVGLVGDLGDEVMNAISTDPFYGDVLQKLLKNDENFGMDGVIPFDGFRIAGQNYELPITSYLVNHYDIIYIAGDNNWIIDATEAGHLEKWLGNNSENQKVLVAFTSNITLLQTLGVNVRQYGWEVSSYKLSTDAPEEFIRGPFGIVSLPSLVPTSNYHLLYIDRTENPHITPVLVSGENEIFIGVDMEKKVVYFSDHLFFHNQHNNGTMTGEGKVLTDLDRLIANIWAWIAETALGDRYDPDLPR